MAGRVVFYVLLPILSGVYSKHPATEYSCAPFFYKKVEHNGSAKTSIVRIQCSGSPPHDGTCDPTFTERIYYRTISGYSCLLEYLARPTPLLEELACSGDDHYDDYFKGLGMKATTAGWVLQDNRAGVLLQVRPNLPYWSSLRSCTDYFIQNGYKYTGGLSGAAWEANNSTHHAWYSPIARDYRHSACVLSADTRRVMPPFSGDDSPPGSVADAGMCPGGIQKLKTGECKTPIPI